jgi:hypothetical protein
MMVFFKKKLRNSRASHRESRKGTFEGTVPDHIGEWGGVGSPSFFVSRHLVVASAFSLVCTAGGLLCGDGKPLPEHSEETGRWLVEKRVGGGNDEPNGQ